MPEDQSRMLEQLLEVGQLLSSSLELGSLLKSILHIASRVVNAESASLLLLDEQTQELYFDVALGLGEEANAVRLPLGQGIAGMCAQTRKPIIIDDARRDPRWSPAMDKASGFVTRSILAVPIIFRGKLCGVLEAINKREGAFFREDLRKFEAFASQAGVSIENARLFASLREERFRLHIIFAQMTDGAILADEAGRVLLANDAARHYLAVGTRLVSLTDALEGMDVTPPLAELFNPMATSQDFTAVRENPKKLILAGKATRVRLGAEAREGAAIAASAGKHPDRPGWLCVFRDVTEERAKETLKRTFLSLISHKLKTPLASIIGFSDILRLDFAQGAGLEKHLKAAASINSQGRKLADLVNKLINYTTIEDEATPLQMEPCPVNELLTEAIAAMEGWLGEKGAEVLLGSSDLVLAGERALLVEVFKNLIENAVKFNNKPDKMVRIAAQAEGFRARLEFIDTGPGIPPEDQERIFGQFHQIEPSFTGQVDGWGLGLPFIKKVVEQHRGSIHLKSKLGEGTTVTLRLPLYRSAP